MFYDDDDDDSDDDGHLQKGRGRRLSACGRLGRVGHVITALHRNRALVVTLLCGSLPSFVSSVSVRGGGQGKGGR